MSWGRPTDALMLLAARVSSPLPGNGASMDVMNRRSVALCAGCVMGAVTAALVVVSALSPEEYFFSLYAIGSAGTTAGFWLGRVAEHEARRRGRGLRDGRAHGSS